MKRLRIFVSTIAVLLAGTRVFSGEAYLPPPSDRVRANIDLGWKFLEGDLAGEEETHQVTDIVWESVDLPHDFCIAGPFRREHNVTQGFLPMTVGWYKKSLFLPACFAEKKIFLIFDGVYRDSDVWMNYRHLHHQEDGYSSFVRDITDVVRVGNRIPNSLVVRADARRHEQDAYDGGGIYRHVWLLVTNKLHVAQWGTCDRNHPSVILWSLENESPLEGTVYGTRIMKKATALAHRLDPSRPTTFAASMPVNTNGYGDAVDVVSYNYHWERADQDHVTHPEWKIGLVSEYSAARARRGVYGIESLNDRPEAEAFNLYGGTIQSAYEMCTRVETAWRRIEARPYLGGGCLWSGMDAWGEGNAWPFVSRGDGALDACLVPKDVYFYFVSQWTAEPMVHILPHWNWPDKRGHPIDVWCYSNCDQVELFLNGESLGSRSRPPEPMPWKPAEKPAAQRSEKKAAHLSWKVPYQPGSLRAVGKRGGQVVCTKTIHTVGQPAQIRLSRLMSQFLDDEEIPPPVADGRDVAVLKAEVLDEDGHTVPTANNVVHFAVDGRARIVGVGNGNITSHEENKADSRKAYNGSCIVIVQTSTGPGEFSVIATSPALAPGRITIDAAAPKPVGLAIVAEPVIRPSHVDRPITITAAICDRFGVAIPTAQSAVTIRIDGPATFQNGRTMTTVQPNGGTASTTVNLDGKSGIIRITTDAEGLEPARAQIRVE